MRRIALPAAALFSLLLLPGCAGGEKKHAGAGKKDGGAKAVAFEGAGGWKLHGRLYLPANAAAAPELKAAVICHPMLSRTKETYAKLARALAGKGIAVLAYDPRGHGESTTGTGGKTRPGWKDHMGPSKKDLAFWAGLVDDLAKAKAFLIEKYKIDPQRIAVVGASVGANAALAFGVKDPDLAAVALLSPGKNYRGLATFENAAKIAKPLFVAMGEKDPSAKDAPAKIFEKAAKVEAKDKVLKRYDSGEHGTNLFKKHPELVEELAAWLAARLGVGAEGK